MSDPQLSKPDEGGETSYDLDTSALAALDKFRAEKAAEEAQLLRFTQSSSSSSKSSKKTKAPRQKKEKKVLTPEEEAEEEAKAEAALLAEIEAIADLERLNGVAPDSADSMLANLSSRLQVDDSDGEEKGDEEGKEGEARSLDVDTFRKNVRRVLAALPILVLCQLCQEPLGSHLPPCLPITLFYTN